MACLCIEIGISIIKTVVERQETSVLRSRPGFSEQDRDGMWVVGARTIRRVLAGLAESVKFLALTAQGACAWLVNRAGWPTGPTILLPDVLSDDEQVEN